MIKILVVDDHTIFRQCIVGQINLQEGYEVVSEAATGKAALMLTETLQPDIVILDISLPDMSGIEVARKLKDRNNKSKIILLSMHKVAEVVELLQESGISGYLLKDDTFEDLIYAIKAVCEGKQYVSSSLILEKSVQPRRAVDEPSVLTEREKEVVSLIAEGLNNREIAERLCISIKTVETHRTRIMEKLNARNVADLIKQAIKSGIVKI